MNDVLVWIFLRGGMDGLNVVIPQFDDDYYKARPTIAIAKSKVGEKQTAIPLDSQFGLHPALSPLVPIWDAGHLAFIHACGSQDPSHSHFECQDLLERGFPSDKSTNTGWISRHLQSIKRSGDQSYPALTISSSIPASLRGSVPVLACQSLANFKIQSAPASSIQITKKLAALYQLDPQLGKEAETTMAAIERISRVAAETYTPEAGVTYPENNLANSLKQTAQVIKAKIGVEVVALDMGGFDTHTNQGSEEGALARLLKDLSGSIAAFYQDIVDFDPGVTVLVVSEFGRRVQENGNAGTDHGHGNVVFAVGKSTNGKKVYANWPGLKKDQLYGPGDLNVTIDFRDVLSELVQKRLQNQTNLEQVFPKYKPVNHNIFKAAS
jgi:uncharacterized protein (DUF1501 family)